jgi:DNA-3-methyladenine glycosylase II
MELSLRFSQRSRFEIVDKASSNILKRLLKIGDSIILAEISCSGDIEHPEGLVRWRYLKSDDIDEGSIIAVAHKILSAQLSLHPFYEVAKESKHFSKLINKFHGLKPLLTPTVYESAAWAIMGQQVNLNFAYILKKRLVEKYGRIYQIDGDEFHLFPEPPALAEASVDELRQLQFSTRKAEYIIGLSQLEMQNGSAFDSLSKLNYNEAISKLLEIRGIGIWSANYILMRGGGHLDCLPLGDSGLHKAAKSVFGLGKLPDNMQVEKLARKFIPYRSLFTLYLWYSLMEKENET